MLPLVATGVAAVERSLLGVLSWAVAFVAGLQKFSCVQDFLSDSGLQVLTVTSWVSSLFMVSSDIEELLIFITPSLCFLSLFYFQC